MTTAAVGETLRRVVELACRAPSIGNSQPWRWSLCDEDLDLRADFSQRLPGSDPAGRQLVISCGAALHHARVAAAALGRPAAVVRLPVREEPALLATLRTRPGPVTAGALDGLAALEQRHTDRRRFTTWPMTQDRLQRLARSVDVPEVQALPLTDRRLRAAVDSLVHRTTADPGALVPSDGLLALGSYRDDTLAWVRTGEALSEVWLRATRDGLSVVPLSQVIETDDTRDELSAVFGGLLLPQLLLRVGWQEIGGRQQQRSPRRGVEEVLDADPPRATVVPGRQDLRPPGP